MAIEDRVNAVRSRFDAWQHKVEDYFDKVVELLRQVTALLNEIIVGVTRMIATLVVSSWKLFKEFLLLFFLVLPFLLIIPLGIEIGGSIGVAIEILSGLAVAGLIVFLLVASLIKIEPAAKKQDREFTRSNVIRVTFLMNVLVLGLYATLAIFCVPQSSMIKPIYQIYADALVKYGGKHSTHILKVAPGESVYTYLRVFDGAKVRFNSTAPIRLVIVSSNTELLWKDSINGDTLLFAPISGIIQFDGLTQNAKASISIVSDISTTRGK